MHVQQVAADQATGWVHQHVMADGIAFRVEALEDAQRALVAVAGDAALVFDQVVECEFSMPGNEAIV
jgi:hypothetical protein